MSDQLLNPFKGKKQLSRGYGAWVIFLWKIQRGGRGLTFSWRGGGSYLKFFVVRVSIFSRTTHCQTAPWCSVDIVRACKCVYLNIWISYISEYQKSIKETGDFFDNQPGHRNHATSNLKVLVAPVNLENVYSHCPAPPTNSTPWKCYNLKPLPDLCTEKDLSLLSEKAQRLCQEKNTHVRFEKNNFLVKSKSRQMPHIKKTDSNNRYVCDSQCTQPQ